MIQALNSVEEEVKVANRGGRPLKKEHERATIKLNCWVTPTENNQLQADFTRIKAGRKMAFAHFLKQRLLSGKQAGTPKTDELLLTLIINLQQQERQLEVVTKQLDAQLTTFDWRETKASIDSELTRIRETTNQITTWLYES